MPRCFGFGRFGLAFCCALTGCEPLQEHTAGGAALDVQRPALERTDEVSRAVVESGGRDYVLDAEHLVNYHAYRGLQVIDISDVYEPRIVGRLPLVGADSGTRYPAQLYFSGERAWLLLNWIEGYSGAQPGVPAQPPAAAAIFQIDLHDRAQPSLTDRVDLARGIADSRLVRTGERLLLYLVEGLDGVEQRGRLHAFDVSGDSVIARSSVDLLGPVQALQIQADQLIVATREDPGPSRASRLSVYDIAAADGVFGAARSVKVAGAVLKNEQIAVAGGVLRVASTGHRAGAHSHQLETFELGTRELVAIDSCELGEFAAVGGESLRASELFDERGFFVTADQSATLHALAIDREGNCEERAQHTLPVESVPSQPLARLHGERVRLQPLARQTRLLSVASHARDPATIALYDARASADSLAPLASLSLPLCDASVGALTLRSEGRRVVDDPSTESWLGLLPFADAEQPGIQVLSLTDQSLAARGVLQLREPSAKLYSLDRQTAVNRSLHYLSLLDLRDPSRPKTLGELELSRDYRELFVFGDWVALVKQRPEYTARASSSELQVFPRSADFASDTPARSIAVREGGTWVQVGALLVQLALSVDESGEPPVHTSVQIYDLSDPRQLRVRGRFETDALTALHDPSAAQGFSFSLWAVGETLAFGRPASHSYYCDAAGCTALAWQSHAFDLLDLRDPDRPRLVAPVLLPGQESAATVVADGASLYVSTTEVRPTTDRAERAALASYLYRLELRDPARPVLSARMAVPGPVTLVDGASVYTLKQLYVNEGFSWANLLARVELDEHGARVAATLQLQDPILTGARLDGVGRLVISRTTPAESTSWLELLDARDLSLLARLEFERMVVIASARGRAVFEDDTGLWVFDVRDPRQLVPQAYFAVPAWQPKKLLDRGEILFPLGEYGVFRLPLEQANLRAGR